MICYFLPKKVSGCASRLVKYDRNQYLSISPGWTRRTGIPLGFCIINEDILPSKRTYPKNLGRNCYTCWLGKYFIPSFGATKNLPETIYHHSSFVSCLVSPLIIGWHYPKSTNDLFTNYHCPPSHVWLETLGRGEFPLSLGPWDLVFLTGQEDQADSDSEVDWAQPLRSGWSVFIDLGSVADRSGLCKKMTCI